MTSDGEQVHLVTSDLSRGLATVEVVCMCRRCHNINASSGSQFIDCVCSRESKSEGHRGGGGGQFSVRM